MKEKIRQHYHWVIGAVLFIELFIFGGTLNIIISIFIKPVTEGLHVLRGSFSLVYVLESITAIISTMFAPKLIARFSYRKCASVLLLVSAAAFFLYSRMESLAGFGVGCVLVGISAGVCSIAGADLCGGTVVSSASGTDSRNCHYVHQPGRKLYQRGGVGYYGTARLARGDTPHWLWPWWRWLFWYGLRFLIRQKRSGWRLTGITNGIGRTAGRR